jgi:hypothetical protein
MLKTREPGRIPPAREKRLCSNAAMNRETTPPRRAHKNHRGPRGYLMLRNQMNIRKTGRAERLIRRKRIGNPIILFNHIFFETGAVIT